MGRLLAYALTLALATQTLLVTGKEAELECSASKKCPKDKPCCSQYGKCGVGAYCLGGCDARGSNTLDACVPAPVCKSKTYKWNDLDDVVKNTKYLGDASEADWVSSGQPMISNNNLLLTMAPKSVGTLLASNHYMWYGKTTAKLKTSRGAGVVTAFILLSDVKDEVDFEFIGTDLETAQTNYYFQGITDYSHGKNHSAPSTFEKYHTYEIDWKPESITWSIDGKTVRTLKRSETMNETSHQYAYPQSPTRVQLSLWPAGLESNGEGTIAWGGGLVDWEHEDVKKHGYYYAMFDEVTIECYDPPKSAKKKGDESYILIDDSGTEDAFEISNKKTVLKSFLGSGTNMSADYATASGTKKSSQTSDVAYIPGLDGVGGPGNDGKRGDKDDDGDKDKSGGGGGGGGGKGDDKDDNSDFSQGGKKKDGEPNSASPQTEQVLKGSVFAVLVALVVLVAM